MGRQGKEKGLFRTPKYFFIAKAGENIFTKFLTGFCAFTSRPDGNWKHTGNVFFKPGDSTAYSDLSRCR